MIGAWLLAAAAAASEGLVFEKWFEERGVEVSIARRPGPIPWIRGTGELPASAETVEAALVDFAGYGRLMAPAVLKATVLSREEATARLHMVWHYPFPFKNRDAVVSYRGEKLTDGRFRLAWHDEARAGDPSEGVRIERVEGETLVDPIWPDRCRVTYTYYGDLGGNFPRSTEERAWRAEPVDYFRAIRRRVRLPDPP